MMTYPHILEAECSVEAKRVDREQYPLFRGGGAFNIQIATGQGKANQGLQNSPRCHSQDRPCKEWMGTGQR